MNKSSAVRKPRWRRMVRGIAVGIVILLLVCGATYALLGYIWGRDLRDELARIREAGHPVTFDDIEAALPPVDEKDNAGRLYKAALTLLAGVELEEELLDAYRDALADRSATGPDESAHQKLQALLAAGEQALALIDRAATMPACRYRFGLRHGVDVALQGLGGTRRTALLLGLRTADRALSGDAAGAVDSLFATLAMRRIFDDEPALIVHLVRVSVTILACRDAVHVLERCDLSQEDLDRLLQALEPRTTHDDFVKMLQVERVFGLRMADDQGIGIQGGPFQEKMAAGYLRDMAAIIDAADRPWPTALDEMENVEPTSIFGGIVLPALVPAARSIGLQLAGSRCTAAAVAVMRHRRRAGKLPAKLADLDGADGMFKDPFTGRSLVYRRDDDAFSVYSVGDDRRDDGGDIGGNLKGKQKDWGVRVRFAR